MAFGGVWKESLSELSGGQKSLLALSLILAMLLFKPAPIYILDEARVPAWVWAEQSRVGGWPSSRGLGSEQHRSTRALLSFNASPVPARTPHLSPDGTGGSQQAQPSNFEHCRWTQRWI